MYVHSIIGQVVEIGKNYIVIEHMPFRYKINCTQQAISGATIHLPISLLLYQNITDDDESWYGFSTKEEYDLFVELIKVTGIGPAKAIKVLGYPTDVVIQALSLEDRRLFLSIPGFGPRLTDKMFLEIGKKYKIK